MRFLEALKEQLVEDDFVRLLVEVEHTQDRQLLGVAPLVSLLDHQFDPFNLNGLALFSIKLAILSIIS